MAAIAQYLDSELVAFLDVETRDEAIEKLVNLASEGKYLGDAKTFHNAILKREDLVSTGIGMGVAIPHAKIDTCEKFFITIGVLGKGVDWHSLDGSPVRLVFMIGGPDDRNTEYLQLLSTLTLVMKDEERRKALLQQTDAEELLHLFDGL